MGLEGSVYKQGTGENTQSPGERLFLVAGELREREVSWCWRPQKREGPARDYPGFFKVDL